MRRWRARHHAAARIGRRWQIVFWSFRVMVGLGMLMFALGAVRACWRALTRKLYDWRWLHRFAVLMGPVGLHRRDRRLDDHRSRAPAVHRLRPAAHRRLGLAAGTRPRWARSLIAFVVVYFAVFGMGIWYMLRLMSRPPQPRRAGARRTRRRSRRHHARHRRSAGGGAPEARAWHDTSISRIVWAVHPGLRGVHVRGDGRLRSRHRHPVSGVRRRPRTRHRDELDRAGVGRQRDLAGAGRRRADGGVSAGLCRRSCRRSTRR